LSRQAQVDVMADEPEISDKLQIVIGSLISLLLVGAYLIFSGSFSSSRDAPSTDLLKPLVSGDERAITDASTSGASSNRPNTSMVQVGENKAVITPSSPEIDGAAISSSQTASGQSTGALPASALPRE
jgi:hypothetical protein